MGKDETAVVHYDSGDDGQRCEHIGFHMSLKVPVFVNRKWNFNLDPKRLGGPTGQRAVKISQLIAFTPQIGYTMFMLHFISYTLFVVAVMRFGIFALYPLLQRITKSFIPL